ncbi:MAG TPA: Ada metal-binding domain-containing protein, partial [Sphingomicrobium sp.]
MATVTRLDPDTAWAAFMRRDRSWDGRVIVAVQTTGIYCKPSCPARRPKRENVTLYASIDEARAAGFRACLRCKPDEVGRDREAIASAVKLIEAAEEVPSLITIAEAVAAAVRLIERAEEAPSLAELSERVGYAPHHFQRLFKRDLG